LCESTLRAAARQWGLSPSRAIWICGDESKILFAVETALYVLGLLLLFVFCFLAIASLVFGLPGTLLIVAAALVYGWATGFAAVTWTTIAWLAGLAALGEGIEFFAGTVGAAGERPSRRVTVLVLVGGVAGGIVGTPFLIGVGSLIGALLGAFAGAALAVASEGGSAGSAFRTGMAAMRGRLLGFVLKTAVAVVMLVVLIAAAI
jgi:uncharacterized protein YqgC (DUF456 family)